MKEVLVKGKEEEVENEEEEEHEISERREINWDLLNSVLSSNTSSALLDFLQKDKEKASPQIFGTSATSYSIDAENISIAIDHKEEQRSNELQPAPHNSVFKLHSYWEDRFSKEESYEWLGSWEKVRKQVLPHLSADSRILIVGCGNSSFSADIYDEGFENIVNIDFSSTVIEKMKQINRHRTKMEWLVMDMTLMSFPDSVFDLVIDKAAMDALVVDEGDVWNPKDDVIESVDRMCKCATRVLTGSGKFLQISFAQPHFRTKYLIGYRADREECSAYSSHQGHSKRYGWELSFEEISSEESGCLNLFLYKMKK